MRCDDVHVAQGLAGQRQRECPLAAAGRAHQAEWRVNVRWPVLERGQRTIAAAGAQVRIMVRATERGPTQEPAAANYERLRQSPGVRKRPAPIGGGSSRLQRMGRSWRRCSLPRWNGRPRPCSSGCVTSMRPSVRRGSCAPCSHACRAGRPCTGDRWPHWSKRTARQVLRQRWLTEIGVTRQGQPLRHLPIRRVSAYANSVWGRAAQPEPLPAQGGAGHTAPARTRAYVPPGQQGWVRRRPGDRHAQSRGAIKQLARLQRRIRATCKMNHREKRPGIYQSLLAIPQLERMGSAVAHPGSRPADRRRGRRRRLQDHA
jgi:hypothetical protein